ncbi:MAG: DNA polymerase III subunit delta [Nocardioidaceae bacterium]
MADPSPRDVLGTTLLVTGSSEFMAERRIGEVRSTVKRADGDADVSELAADQLGAGALAEVASPSLFAALRCVVVRGLEDLPDAAVEPLLSYVAAPADDVALVLRHSGGVKARSLLDKLRKAGAREVKAEALKRWELPGWVAREFRTHKIRIDAAAANALVDSVGDDMRALAAAVDQLAVDAEDRPVDEDVVRLYFGGRAEVKGFAVADAAIDGLEPQALEQLRWAFAAKVDPVLITSAVAGGLRGVARFASAPRGLREADLARLIGVPPWKLKTLSAQARGWSPRGLALAIQAAARADADVKGAGGDRLWSCERLVISVVRARAFN